MLKQVSSIGLKYVQIEAINMFFDFRTELVIKNHMKKELMEVYETQQIVDMSKRKNNITFEIEVLSMLAVNFLGNFRIFQFALAICWQKQKNTKDLAETFVYYVGSGYGIPQHFAKGSDFVV